MVDGYINKNNIDNEELVKIDTEIGEIRTNRDIWLDVSFATSVLFCLSAIAGAGSMSLLFIPGSLFYLGKSVACSKEIHELKKIREPIINDDSKKLTK